MSPVQTIASLIVCMQRDCRHQHKLWEPLSTGYAGVLFAQWSLGTSDSSTGTRKSRPIAEGGAQAAEDLSQTAVLSALLSLTLLCSC